jgi:Ribbon-helix-helix protein, copG family
MTRTQIQLPDPLYRQLKRIAKEQDWSLAEVIRRAGELYASRYPSDRVQAKPWTLPDSLDLGTAKVNLATFRQEAEALTDRTKI